MPVPKSVVKIKKNGIEYTSSVDRASYLLTELQRAALRDVGKFLRKRIIAELKKSPSIKTSLKKSKRLYNSTQYWVRKRETDLQIGYKHETWYAALSELGEKGQPARHILKDTVMKNINEIRRIEGAYLSSIENENKALGLIDADGNPYYPQGDEE